MVVNDDLCFHRRLLQHHLAGDQLSAFGAEPCDVKSFCESIATEFEGFSTSLEVAVVDRLHQGSVDIIDFQGDDLCRRQVYLDTGHIREGIRPYPHVQGEYFKGSALGFKVRLAAAASAQGPTVVEFVLCFNIGFGGVFICVG